MVSAGDVMTDPETLDRVAAAIEQARCPGREGPYGLYDYTKYGVAEPHRVRDFRDPGSPRWGDVVACFDDPKAAETLFQTLTRRHIARAAIAAYEGK